MPSPDKYCPCLLFQSIGICWHTGYKPTIGERQRVSEDLPPIQRMKNRVMSDQEKKERERHR